MSNLVLRLPRYYQDSPQVSELERVLGEQAEALRVSESDTLAQLWIDTATWGLNLWEQWAGLPVDRTRPYSYRRGRVKAKLRGQGDAAQRGGLLRLRRFSGLRRGAPGGVSI